MQWMPPRRLGVLQAWEGRQGVRAHSSVGLSVHASLAGSMGGVESTGVAGRGGRVVG